MKFLHLADLHLGKKLNDYPLWDDQSFVLDQALTLAKQENVDAIIIAGDIYDSASPSAETMDFYDDFLTKLHHLGLPVIMISGNHDSPERLGVASRILRESDIHIVTNLTDALRPIEVKGVNFYPLPYFRISDFNHALGTDCHGYEEAIGELLSRMGVDETKKNVLVAHQPILPLTAKVPSSGSETSLDIDSHGDVAGSSIIDIRLFDRFDYLALGHIHKAQNVSAKARYPGALLKYHVKEASAKRSFTIVDIQNKDVHIEEHPLRLRRDLVILRGSLEQLLNVKEHHGDFVRFVLEEDIIIDSPYEKLKAVFPYCIGIEYAQKGKDKQEGEILEDLEDIDKADLFARFYEEYGNGPLDEKEKKFVEELFARGEERR